MWEARIYFWVCELTCNYHYHFFACMWDGNMLFMSCADYKYLQEGKSSFNFIIDTSHKTVVI